MNGWDVLTWICSAALAGSAALIFVLFMRDAGSALRRAEDDPRDES